MSAPHDPEEKIAEDSDNPIDALGEDENRDAGTDDECDASHAEVEGDETATPQDEFFESFGEGSQSPIGINPKDGMIDHIDATLAPAPKMSLDSLICLADTREFVEAFKDEATAIVASRAMEDPALSSKKARLDAAFHLRRLARPRYRDDGSEVEVRGFAPDQVEVRWGIWVAKVIETWVPVRPVRIRCKNLMRLRTLADDVDNEDGTPVYPMHSYCTARRTVGGAFYSLMDQSVIACEFRDPLDNLTPRSIAHFVERKIAQGKERTHLNILRASPTGKGEVVIDSPATAQEKIRESWKKKAEEFGPYSGAFVLDCPPTFAPGKTCGIVWMDPASALRRLSMDDHGIDMVAIVGTTWLPHEEALPRQGSYEYHTMLLRPDHYGLTTPPEWLAGWPQNASGLLAASFERLPEHVAERLRLGRNVLVTGAVLEEAETIARLIRYKALVAGCTVPKGAEVDTVSSVRRPELLAVLDRLPKENA